MSFWWCPWFRSTENMWKWLARFHHYEHFTIWRVRVGVQRWKFSTARIFTARRRKNGKMSEIFEKYVSKRMWSWLIEDIKIMTKIYLVSWFPIATFTHRRSSISISTFWRSFCEFSYCCGNWFFCVQLINYNISNLKKLFHISTRCFVFDIFSIINSYLNNL